jgi:hypothetical protein
MFWADTVKGVEIRNSVADMTNGDRPGGFMECLIENSGRESVQAMTYRPESGYERTEDESCIK